MQKKHKGIEKILSIQLNLKINIKIIVFTQILETILYQNVVKGQTNGNLEINMSFATNKG